MLQQHQVDYCQKDTRGAKVVPIGIAAICSQFEPIHIKNIVQKIMESVTNFLT